jgi:hypothetical protein
MIAEKRKLFFSFPDERIPDQFHGYSPLVCWPRTAALQWRYNHCPFKQLYKGSNIVMTTLRYICCIKHTICCTLRPDQA